MGICYFHFRASSRASLRKAARVVWRAWDGDAEDLVEYTYLGRSAIVVVDYVQPDVQLNRHVAYNGDQVGGEYPGWDRFGRPRNTRWVDGQFLNSTVTGNPLPSFPQIVEYAYEYDKRGNVVKRYDDRPGLPWGHRHAQLEYDGLHRLVEAKFGVEDSGFTYSTRSKKWELDALGNWSAMQWRPDGSGVYQMQEDRSHNAANEIEDRTPDSGGSGPTLDLAFDDAGNIESQEVPGSGGSSVEITYIHDAWNRLVRVKYDEVLRAEFEYNALHQRVMKTADTRGSNPRSDEGPNGTIDQRRLMFYSADWQLMEERIDDDYDGQAFDESRRVQYVWGIRGTDDIVLHRVDADVDDDYDDTFYHLTDTQFSTIVVINDIAQELERISYDAYGRPRHHPLGDMDGNGVLASADVSLWTTLANGGAGAGTVLDLNRDGFVDSTDRGLISANLGTGLVNGALSFGAIDNQLGYAGYHYHCEMHLYLARHRWFDPELGRWLQRDPAGYVDGMNLYLYGVGSPFVFVDPMGLASDSKWNPCNWFKREPTAAEKQIALNHARENGDISPGENPEAAINEALNDPEVREEIREHHRELRRGGLIRIPRRTRARLSRVRLRQARVDARLVSFPFTGRSQSWKSRYDEMRMRPN